MNEIDERLLENYKFKRFSQKARIKVIPGQGGIGCFSNIRTRSITTSNNDGGDGGLGQDIYFKAHSKLDSDLSYIKKDEIVGIQGVQGKSNFQHGKNRKPLFYSVPVGTSVYKVHFNKNENKEQLILIKNLFSNNASVKVAKGGQGGLGSKNKKYQPNLQKGQKGQKTLIELQFSFPNDVILIGMTGTGKSTLMAMLTKVLTKITPDGPNTLQPILGKMNYIDKTLSILDMPPFNYRQGLKYIDKYDFRQQFKFTQIIAIVLDCSKHKYLLYHVTAILRYLRDNEIQNKKIIFILNKKDTITPQIEESI